VHTSASRSAQASQDQALVDILLRQDLQCAAPEVDGTALEPGDA
jgi:hypothetical protein